MNISISVISQIEADGIPTVSPTASSQPTFEHRGAARQMYGSGSLRLPGSIPTVQEQQQQQPLQGRIAKTSSSQSSNRRRQPLPYPVLQPVPVPIPIHDFDGYAISRSGGLSIKPPNRGGGLYGGRPEYYAGRPDHGLSRSKYPIDHGFIPGRGFGFPPINPGHGRITYDRPIFHDTPRHGTGFMRISDEEEIAAIDEDEEYEHSCGGGCARDEFLCIRSCTCIKDDYR